MKVTYTRAEAQSVMNLIKMVAIEKGTVSARDINSMTLEELVARDKDANWNTNGDLELVMPEEKLLGIIKVLSKHTVPLVGIINALEGLAKTFKYVMNGLRDDLKSLGL